ncbi:MAG: cytochrome c3 family protein [Desulfohalobiaceae bacterium]|nr:cytochrome c3 family protein [Desulfohalobiaceae bacterium]
MYRIVLFSVCVALLCLFSVSGIQALEMPQEITLKDAKGKTQNPVYTPVVMPHQHHVTSGVMCGTCHHKWEDQSQPPERCIASGCHDQIGAEGEDMNKENAAYNAHHNPQSKHSCLGCHKKKKSSEKKAGPIACNKCHDQ